MDLINVYIPSEFHRIINTSSGAIYDDIRYRFQVLQDNDTYYLQLKNNGNTSIIPSETINRIIEDTRRNPKAILYYINYHLQTLKNKLIAESMPSSNYQRLDILLDTAKGYAEKDESIILFYDAFCLQPNLLKRNGDASFSIENHIYKTADDNYINSGTQTFFCYCTNNQLLKINTAFKDGLFYIASIVPLSDMKYLSLYQQNKGAADIYAVHTNKKRTLFKKIILR